MPKYGSAVTDKDLLAQLDSGSDAPPGYGEAVNDPDLLAQLEGPTTEQKFAELNHYTGGNRTPFDTARDIASGAISGLGKGGQFIADKFTGGAAPKGDVDQLANMVHSRDQSVPGQMATGGGSFLPYAMAGGSSILGQVLAGTAHGALTTDPKEKNFFDLLPQGRVGGAIEGAVSSLIPVGAGKLFSKMLSRVRPTNATIPNYGQQLPENYAYHNPAEGTTSGVQAMTKEGQPIPMGVEGQQASIPGRQNFDITSEPSATPTASFKNTPSEFHNQPFQVPEVLKPKEVTNDSEILASALAHHLTGGQELEDQAKLLAKDTKTAFEKTKAETSAPYQEIWNHPAIGDNNFKFSNFRKDYIKTNKPFPEGTKLYDSFQEMWSKPTLENMHNFKQELGGEIGYLERQERMRKLLPEDRKLLSNYRRQYGLLSQDIDTGLTKAAPELKGAYQAAGENWKQNMLPYYKDRDLMDMATGRVTNPTRSQVKSIFQSPEPDAMGKVANDIGEVGRKRIAHLATGLLPEENSLSDILKAHSSLRKSGLSSYLPENFSQSVQEAKGMSANEKAAQVTESQKAKLAQSLQRDFEKRKPNLQELQKFDPEKESQNNIKFYQKQITNEQTKLSDAIANAQRAQAEVDKRATTANKQMASKTAQDVKLAQARIDLLKQAIAEQSKKKDDLGRRIVKGLAQETAYKVGGLPAYIVAKNILK